MENIIGFPVLLGFFVAALVMGLVISRTNFCTMGAVSDWVNLRDFGRLGAWLLAIAVTMMCVTVLELLLVFNLDEARPPYRSSSFAWLRYLLGGLIFGVGMTLAGGCASRNLVRLGGGSIKALITLGITAIFAYLMTKTVFYEIAFYNWMQPAALELSQANIPSQDIGAMLSGALSLADAAVIRLAVALIITAAVIGFILKTRGVRGNMPNVIAGLVIGGCVSIGWYLSAGPIGMQWAEAAEWADAPPVGVGPQSFTFINPLGEYLSLLIESDGFWVLLTAGMAAAAGLVVGALIDAVITRQFRFSWFASLDDFRNNAIGGACMGIGGVLGLGCTVGQGISGLSTLAAGSFLTLFAIVFSCAATLKYQYYRLLYEEASFMDALLSALVDMRALPQNLRKLEAL